MKPFENIYRHQYYLVLDEIKWPLKLHNNMLAPTIIKDAGRPQTRRRKETNETKTFKRSSSVRCSNCGEWGHNVRTCKVEKSSKQGARKKKLNSTQVTSCNYELSLSSCQTYLFI